MSLVQGRPLSFVVPGEPVPQAELKPGAHGKLYYPNGRELRDWRRAVGWAAQAELFKLGRGVAWPLPKATAVELDVTFFITRPPTVTRTLPTVKPDLQHLVRAVEDALKRIGWADDSQVTDTTSRKRYAPRDAKPCTSITVRPILEVS